MTDSVRTLTLTVKHLDQMDFDPRRTWIAWARSELPQGGANTVAVELLDESGCWLAIHQIEGWVSGHISVSPVPSVVLRYFEWIDHPDWKGRRWALDRDWAERAAHDRARLTP